MIRLLERRAGEAAIDDEYAMGGDELEIAVDGEVLGGRAIQDERYGEDGERGNTAGIEEAVHRVTSPDF